MREPRRLGNDYCSEIEYGSSIEDLQGMLFTEMAHFLACPVGFAIGNQINAFWRSTYEMEITKFFSW